MRASLDMALTHALLRRVAAGEEEPALRLFRPAPTMAFGRLDALRPGFAEAVAAARAHGFAPVLRLGGGHAAAYDAGSVLVEQVVATRSIAEGLQGRFAQLADGIVAALRALGVAAEVGELPGEYCPGAWSVHVPPGVKVAGAAQRSMRGAALATAFVAVDGGERLRAALVDVYAALGMDWDPATAGALADADPALTPEAVLAALGEALGAPAEELSPATAALATTLEPRHRL